MRSQAIAGMQPEVVRLLNTCIETSIDAEKGYACAAADARDAQLEAVFREFEAQRADFVRQLRAALADVGAHAENHGSAKGSLHRGFVGVRRALEGRSDTLLVAECERGERSALAAYDQAIARVGLNSVPVRLRAMIIDQRASIKLAHDDMLRRLASRS